MAEDRIVIDAENRQFFGAAYSGSPADSQGPDRGNVIFGEETAGLRQAHELGPSLPFYQCGPVCRRVAPGRHLDFVHPASYFAAKPGKGLPALTRIVSVRVVPEGEVSQTEIHSQVLDRLIDSIEASM